MLTFRNSVRIWFDSLKLGNLQRLQDSLVKLLVPKLKPGIVVKNEKIKIDEENHINEVNFQITNNTNSPTKHIVFIHGYGASLGCFSRNFSMVNLFKDLKHNYHIHFLDNKSFGLSSNPKIPGISGIIPKCPSIQINDSTPTDPKKLYNKYYKLVDSYVIDPKEFKDYEEKFTPILEKVEEYYLDGINDWKRARGIDIDYLVGHSYGGYWSGSYAVKNDVGKLILLSPVGVERHVHALPGVKHIDQTKDKLELEPSLDPSKYNFLSRFPILKPDTVSKWYYQPYLPRVLKFLGPWGVQLYWKMWYSKLAKINKLKEKRKSDGKADSQNVYGTDGELSLIIEYLYNSITNGTMSDIYIKYLLTPSTVSKVPLYDKFMNFKNAEKSRFGQFKIHFIYGQYDFMNSEAAEKLANELNSDKQVVEFHKIDEGGHNLYIDNPFDTNQLIYDIVKTDEK